MGTKSGKAKMVIAMRALHVRRIKMRLVRIMRRERNVLMDVVDCVIKKELSKLESSRYVRRNKYRRRAYNRSEQKPWTIHGFCSLVESTIIYY